MTLSAYIDYVILPILGLSLLLVFIRLARGPSVVDRVVALDLLITIGVSVITVYSISTQKSTLIDVAMILALIAFLGTIAFAYYLEKRGRK